MKEFFKSKLNVVLTIILVVVVAATVVVAVNLFGNKTVYAKDFTEYTEEETVQWLKDNGIKEDNYTITYEYSDDVDEGKLIYQSVKANDEIDSSISFVYSKGPDPEKAKIELPDFKSYNVEQIKSWASENGITVNFAYSVDSDEDDGTIISQSVLAGTEISKGDSVDVVVAGEDPNSSETSDTEINVPDDYIGYAEEDFVKTIEDLGLKAVNSGKTHKSTKYKDGLIYSYTSSSDGVTFKKGDSVTYTLVKNDSSTNDSTSETVTVGDNYVGLTEDEFVKAIEALGLKAENTGKTYTSKKYSAGCVYTYQSTSDGITFKKGDTVKYGLVAGSSSSSSSSSDVVTVGDDYVGLTEAEFVKAIEALGLKAENTGKTYTSKKYSSGCVYTYQSTSDGITFHKGDTVKYGLVAGSSNSSSSSSSSDVVTVPDSYIGYSEADFIKAIESLDLKASNTGKTYSSSKYSAGSVYTYTSTSDGYTFHIGDTVKYGLVKGSSSSSSSTSSSTTNNSTSNEKVTLQNLVGKTLSEASSYCSSAGLGISSSESYSDSVESGKIISMNPGSGSSVNKGTTVSVVVSKGAQQATTGYIMSASSLIDYYGNTSSYEATKSAITSYFTNQGFNNVTIKPISSYMTPGVINSVSVNGNKSYAKGYYALNTPIVVEIVQTQAS